MSKNTQKAFKSLVSDIRKTLLAELEQATVQRYSWKAKDRSKVELSYENQQQYERLIQWLDDPGRLHKGREQNLKELIKERAYTLTNRLVILMQLECRDIRKTKLISRGIEDSAFRKEQEFFVALTQGDDLGFRFILQQVWDQLALELPALFEYNEIHQCIPLPGPVLLSLIEKLNGDELREAWTDDTTLGWLYQYWNDPDRKAVDAKLNTTSGKVEIHELSDKTQLFTERYMVEWLVQNSLGAQWLAMCQKNRWETSAIQVIEGLQEKRSQWASETEALPTQGQEEFWKYYVPQDIAPETIEAAPSELSQVRILDPAMGSGHFLVYVFDFLYELYQEEGSFSGKSYSAEEVVRNILERNLHGIDIDNRAVQIGAAALYIKAQERVSGFTFSKLNLVASDLGLSHLEKDDPGVVRFTRSLEEELGIHREVSYEIIKALKGAEYLGSLLQVDREIDRIVKSFRLHNQALDIQEVRAKILTAIESFIHNHDQGEDLGVRSLAEQMGKGLRLIELLGQKYDVIVANPPYLGIAKAKPDITERIIDQYPDSKTDLYGVFIERGMQLTENHGFIAMVTMQNFMFLSSFDDLRASIIKNTRISCVAHLGAYTFQELRDHALAVAFVFQHGLNREINEGLYQRYLVPKIKGPSLVNQSKVYSFPQSRFAEIPGSPMIYWWPEEFRQAYLEAPKLGEVTDIRQGLATSNNNRFLRRPFEVRIIKAKNPSISEMYNDLENNNWQPFVKGAAGRRWFEELNELILWKNNGKEVKAYASSLYKSASRTIKSQDKYFEIGIAFSSIDTKGFSCRIWKYSSTFDVVASSIFLKDKSKLSELLCLLSSNIMGYVAKSLNPTVHNQVGDVNRYPFFDKQAGSYRTTFKTVTDLYNKLFSSTESNLEYTYNHISQEYFEVEEARIRDDIDKELMASFSQDTREAIYKEIGESVFDYPLWDGSEASIPSDFAEQYQKEFSILELSRHYQLHPDSLLEIKEKLGLSHEGQRKNKAFKDLSWAIGVLLGRFDAYTGGLVEMAEERLKEMGDVRIPPVPLGHPHGLLYLSALDEMDRDEDWDRPGDFNRGQECLDTLKEILRYKWGEENAGELWEEIEAALVLDCQTDWSPAQRSKKNLNGWIRTKAFGMHESIYQKRPIYFPLVSAKKNFFVWVNIHKWNEGTLNAVLANYLKPDVAVLEERIKRMREDIQSSTDSKQINQMEKSVTQLTTLLDELKVFTAKVEQLATVGPDPALTEVDAPYVMDLDDGVMVNSSALWELVLPLWKEPKKWWVSLSRPQGKKDFDWSHLAMRYWPERVFAKVKKDPSLAVAHSDYGAYEGRDLFEELHPEAAKKWAEQQRKKKEQELDFG